MGPLTGAVYTLIGSSKLGGFVFFSWLGFWGLFFFYRAFTIAVPLGRRRSYALLLFFLPSLVFWPSSIGKEAWMMFSLGIAAYGVAKILTYATWRGLIICGVGLWAAGMVRPHMAALVAVSLAAAVITRKSKAELRELAPVVKGGAIVIVAVLAAVLVVRTDRFAQRQWGLHAQRYPEPNVRRWVVVRSLDRGFPGEGPARGHHRVVPPLRLRDRQPAGALGGDRRNRVAGLLSGSVPLGMGGDPVAEAAAVRGVLLRLHPPVHRRVLELRELRPPGPSARAALPGVPGPLVDPARGGSAGASGGLDRLDAGAPRYRLRVSVSSRRSRSVVDGVGAVLLLLYVGAIVVAGRKGGTPGPEIALTLGAAVALVVGRLAGLVHRAIVPAAVVVIGAVVVASGPLIGGGPLEGPFGYRNATGAFCVLATIAALMVAASVPRWWTWVLAILAAVPFAFVAAADSAAAGLSLLMIGVALVGLFGSRWVRVSIVVVATLFAVTFAGTVVLGAGYRPGLDNAAVRALTERRIVLWHESLQIIAAHPGGVGPDRFSQVSPTARQDPDARWAHDEFLQQGVELGVVGLAILLLIVLWGFARLWVHPSPDMVVGLGAAALAALCIHACVDYVAHFPAVPLAAAALVGTAQAVPSRRFTRGSLASDEEGVEGGGDPFRVARTPTPG